MATARPGLAQGFVIALATSIGKCHFTRWLYQPTDDPDLGTSLVDLRSKSWKTHFQVLLAPSMCRDIVV